MAVLAALYQPAGSISVVLAGMAVALRQPVCVWRRVASSLDIASLFAKKEKNILVVVLQFNNSLCSAGS